MLIVFALSIAFYHSCPAQDQQFGVNVHNAGQNGQVPSMLADGFSLRADLHWSSIEVSPGVYSFEAYGQLDAYLFRAAQLGLEPVIDLDGTPSFYDDGSGLPTSPEAVQAYAKFVTAVVHHFKYLVHRYEIWNEWNLNLGNTSNPKIWGQAPDYVNLLKYVYPAIKAEDPKAIVIGGSVGGTDGNWIDRFIAAGGLSHLDALSVHPYVERHTHGNADSREFIWPATTTARQLPYMPGTPEEAMAWLDSLKAHLDAVSGRSPPIYLTEIGWPSSTDEFGVLESVQGNYLSRFMMLARSRPWIAGVWWYDLVDDGSDSTNINNRFGLFRQDGSEKPQYAAFMKLKSVLQSNTSFKQNVTAEGDVEISTSASVITDKWSPLNYKSDAIDPVSMSETSLNFGNQVERTKSGLKVITILNSGTTPFTITNITKVGGTPWSFPIASTCGSNLSANARCTVSMIFLPGGVGVRDSTLVISGSAGTHTVALKGVGTTSTH